VVAPADVRLPQRLVGWARAGEEALTIRPGEALRVVSYRDSG
jgi:hypothetical protein